MLTDPDEKNTGIILITDSCLKETPIHSKSCSGEAGREEGIHPLNKFHTSEMPASKSSHGRLVESNILALQRQTWALGDVPVMNMKDSPRRIHIIFVDGVDF